MLAYVAEAAGLAPDARARPGRRHRPHDPRTRRARDRRDGRRARARDARDAFVAELPDARLVDGTAEQIPAATPNSMPSWWRRRSTGSTRRPRRARSPEGAAAGRRPRGAVERTRPKASRGQPSWARRRAGGVPAVTWSTRIWARTSTRMAATNPRCAATSPGRTD
ncbi:hypothetical protein ACU686_18430 [Yinghuangia aomiensis]